MSADVAYLDTSAFLKTVRIETETAALGRYLAEWRQVASSELLVTEALRAARRWDEESLLKARLKLGGLILSAIDRVVLNDAALLKPAGLRSLDAIHLATAQLLGEDLGVVVTYDARMAEGARALGMRVAAPA